MKRQKQQGGQSGWSRLRSDLQKLPMVAMAMVFFMLASNVAFGQISLTTASSPAITTFSGIGSTATANIQSGSNSGSFVASTGSIANTNARTNINPTYGGTNIHATTLAQTVVGTTYGFVNLQPTTGSQAVGFFTGTTGTQYFGPNSIMAKYINSNASGTNITQLAVTYDIEVFQIATAHAKVDFYYSYDGTNWLYLRQGSLDRHRFPTESTGFGGSAPTITYNGNPLSFFTSGTSGLLQSPPPVVTASTFNIDGLNLASGAVIYFRWDFSNPGFKYNQAGGSSSMEMGLKSVQVTPTTGSASSNPTVSISLSSSAINKETGITITATSSAPVSGDQIVTVDVAQELPFVGDTTGGYTPAPISNNPGVTPVVSQIQITILSGYTTGYITFTPTDTLNTGNQMYNSAGTATLGTSDQSWTLAISDVTSGLTVDASTGAAYKTLTIHETNDAISLTGSGTYYQRFDNGALDTAYSDMSAYLPRGWYTGCIGSNSNNCYAGDVGVSSTGNSFSYGKEHSSNRSLGNYPTSNTKYQGDWGAKFVNNTGGNITDLLISYTGRQWSDFGGNNTNEMDFYYSTTATSLAPITSTTGWNAVTALNFVSPTHNTTQAVLDGTASGNYTNLSAKLTGLNISNGQTFWVKWVHPQNAAAKADAMATDDFEISIPSPATKWYFVDANADPNSLSNWYDDNLKTNVSNHPANFTTDNVIYNIQASTTLTNNWAVSGQYSKILVGDGTNPITLTTTATKNCSGTVDVAANGVLELKNGTNPTLGQLDNNSTVIYDAVSTAQTVTATAYGNLTIQNNTSTVLFPASNLSVNGTFLLNNVTVDANSASAFCIFTLNGDYTLSGTVNFGSNWRLNIRHNFAGAGDQLISSSTSTRTIPMFGFYNAKTSGKLSIDGSSTIIDNAGTMIFLASYNPGTPTTFVDNGATIVTGGLLELNGESDYSTYTLTGTMKLTCEQGASTIEANTLNGTVLAKMYNLTIDTILSFRRATASNGSKKAVTIDNLDATPTWITGTLALNSGELILSGATPSAQSVINVNNFTMTNKNGKKTIFTHTV